MADETLSQQVAGVATAAVGTKPLEKVLWPGSTGAIRKSDAKALAQPR